MNATDLPIELHVAFGIQRAAYDLAPFAEWDERRSRLERLRGLLVDDEAAIEAAIDSDFAGVRTSRRRSPKSFRACRNSAARSGRAGAG